MNYKHTSGNEPQEQPQEKSTQSQLNAYETIQDLIQHKPSQEDTYHIKYPYQAVPNPTSMNPKRSKYQQKNDFIFKSS